MKLRSSPNSDFSEARQRRNSLYKNEETNTNTDEDSNEPEELEEPQAQPVRQNTNLKITSLLGVLVVLGVLGLVLFVKTDRDNLEAQNIMERVIKLREKFPSQSENLWHHISHVLHNANNKQNRCPSVLLLLSRGDKPSEDSINCLIEKVAYDSALILGGGHHKFSEEDFNCDGCTNSTRQKLLGTNGIPVVVIKQLEKFPIKAVKALHNFCDEYETDFAKAAYILTLTADRNGEEKPVKAAEKRLWALWSGEQKSDYLNPLITRLTSLVEFVKPEEKLPC